MSRVTVRSGDERCFLSCNSHFSLNLKKFDEMALEQISTETKFFGFVDLVYSGYCHLLVKVFRHDHVRCVFRLRLVVGYMSSFNALDR